MPAQAAASRRYAGEWGSPDGHLWYVPDRLYAEVAGWGVAGRADYVDFRLGADLAWGVVYAGWLCLALALALRPVLREGDRRRGLALLPLATLAADYLENALGIFLVSRFPQRFDALAWTATTVTAVKWTTLAAAHLVLAGAVIAAVRRWLAPPA